MTNTTAEPTFLIEAFSALRDPKSDPDGPGRNFCLTTATINGVLRWAITAVDRAPDGSIIHLPLFFALIPGVDTAAVEGEEQRIVDSEDFGRQR